MHTIYFLPVNVSKFIEVSDQQAHQIVPKSITKHFGSYDNPEVTIPKWDIWRMDQITKNMVSWQATCLWMFGFKKSEILIKINHICFNNLKWLSLSNNNIQSIEILSRMRAPHLQGIYLQNNIHSISSLRKCVFILDKIGISNNKISDMQKLSECNLKKQLIFLECEKYCGYNQSISPCVKTIVRLQSKSIKEIKGCSENLTKFKLNSN